MRGISNRTLYNMVLCFKIDRGAIEMLKLKPFQ